MSSVRRALLAAGFAAVLGASGQGGDETGAVKGSAASGATPEAGTPEAILASFPVPYNTADLLNGKAKFATCRSCHTLKKDGPNGVGPNLYGMFGRRVGAVRNYKYSAAVKAADFVWDAEKVDQWLTKPKQFLPGTKMTFKGQPQAKDRIDLIAYLMMETGYRP